MLENNYKFMKYQTNKVTQLIMQMEKTETNYFRKHLFKSISESTLLYINGSQICFKVYGLKLSHKLVSSDSKVDYQPEQADIDQINTFIKQTKSDIVAKTPVR